MGKYRQHFKDGHTTRRKPEVYDGAEYGILDRPPSPPSGEIYTRPHVTSKGDIKYQHRDFNQQQPPFGTPRNSLPYQDPTLHAMGAHYQAHLQAQFFRAYYAHQIAQAQAQARAYAISQARMQSQAQWQAHAAPSPGAYATSQGYIPQNSGPRGDPRNDPRYNDENWAPQNTWPFPAPPAGYRWDRWRVEDDYDDDGKYRYFKAVPKNPEEVPDGGPGKPYVIAFLKLNVPMPLLVEVVLGE